MKKFVIFTLIIAMAAGAVFAQTANGISVNAWGRGVFAPLVVEGPEKADGKVVNKDGNGDDEGSLAYSGAGVTWGGHKIRSDFRVNGNADFVGFQVQLNGEDPSVGDNMYIWAKPFSNDILKLYVGKFDIDNLRGKIGTDTGFENFVLNPMDEDTIFWRFRAGGDGAGNLNNIGSPHGYMLSSEPIEGLFIGLRVNGSIFDNWGGGKITKAVDAYRFMQAGFGYEIADIGHIRAQWIGGWFGGKIGDEDVGKAMGKGTYDIGPDSGLDNTARIEAAFALTAVQNLLIDLGGKFWLPISDKDGEAKATKGVVIALGAKYRMDAFQIIAHIKSDLGSYDRTNKDDKSADGLSLAVNLLPSYDLDAFTIGGSLGMTVSAPGKNDKGETPDGAKPSMQFGFGGYAQKGLGSGNVRAALAYKTATIVDGGAYGRGVFSIPVILEYAFF